MGEAGERGGERQEAGNRDRGSITMASSMTDSHRRFLQVLMSNGIIDAAEARRLHRFFCEQHKVYYAHDKLDDFIGIINTYLRPLFMEIRKGRSEDNGKIFYALVNLAITEATKVASDYAENELELFKKTMDLIVESESGYASSTNILNLSDKLQSKKMRKKEVEHVLQKFVQDKWLSERHGEYTLHTRCIMELDQYICETYQDVKKCNICHSLAIQGQFCETCGIKMHLPCTAKYFKSQPEPRCPHCNDIWPHDTRDLVQPDSHLSPRIPRTPRRISSSEPK
ncbi:non-structural maintenance of chromosomes element 1 homolog isoform X2 [Sarcophilus harrisii]|uniref:non-structural maintenance of chromosomes element 1 homolog isoform X2 n=1 Tax=Sarcophilus harrisii TaxID=9305 RepID=UPI000226FA4D|nr:non-structural maintenance of chromosomes element 1 homolog isoform X2 [Sarcophilus harrisii]